MPMFVTLCTLTCMAGYLQLFNVEYKLISSQLLISLQKSTFGILVNLSHVKDSVHFTSYEKSANSSKDRSVSLLLTQLAC